MSQQGSAWLDGSPVAADWIDDRGLHYGDGLFETMIVGSAGIRFKAQHVARLADSCRRLGIALDAAAALDRAEQLAGQTRGLLKLIVTRGRAVARGYAPAGTETARQLLLRYPLPDADSSATAAETRVVLLKATLGENPLLAGMKHLNRLEQVMARAEMRGNDAFEGLLCSSSGVLACGTMTNLFVVRGQSLLTPRVDRCGIAGVMRSVVLRQARRAGIDTQERDLRPEALTDADEVFLTNVRLGIRPVTSLGERSLTAGPLTRQLQQQVGALEA